MSAGLAELLDIVARWIHVIAGIMWVGNSLLWNWLDRNLRPSSSGGEGKLGEIWLLHSGGFYLMQKTLLAGEPLPSRLHWFKWQAYTTWLSGAALLLIVYYAGGRALLGDPATSGLSHGALVAIAAGGIVAGWLLYELLWRVIAPRWAAAAGVLSIAGIAAIAWLFLTFLHGRAAFLHVGALLGTIMAANVLTTIMPSQRALVASVRAGGSSTLAAELGERAKTRSIHNNYLAFPVIVLMLISHFPGIHSHRHAWALLILLVSAGAAVRHVLNVRFTVRHWVPALAAVIIVAVVSLGLLMRPATAPGSTEAGRVVPRTDDAPAFAEIRSIVDRRCTTCHSREPADPSFGVSPGGAAFDTPEQIRAFASRILDRAVVTRTMPPANATRMTERERAMLGRWLEQAPPSASPQLPR